MKNLLLSLFPGVFLLAMQAGYGQVSQLSWTFDDNNTEFAVINADAANPSFTLSVSDGILEVLVDKKAQDWSFLQKFNIQLNLSNLPTLQFKVRSDGGSPVTFSFKDDNDVVASVSHTPVVGSEMEQIFIDLTTAFNNASGFLPGNIKELQIDISNGWNSTTSDAVYFDFIKLGFAEPLPSGGDYYEQNFNAGLPSDVSNDTKYTPSALDGAMFVDVHNNDRWQALSIGLGAVYDFSDNPVINLKVRTEEAMNLQCFLVDEDGKGFENVYVEGQYNRFELVAGANEFRQAKIFPDDDYTIVSFDFSNADADIVDLSRVYAVKLCANGTAAGFNGDFYIDHIWAGKDVVKTAYIGQLKEKSIYKNLSGQQKILIQEVKNAASVSASGAASLINNVTVDEISYSTFNENGYSQTYGHTYLNYELIADATGSDTITLTATGEGEYANFIEKFALRVTDNNNPEINPLDDILAKTGMETSVLVDGISDGDIDIEQELTITAVSDNVSVIDIIGVDYEQAYSKAEITFTPLSAGSSNITITIADDDGASIQESFAVSVFDEINAVPEINQAEELSLVNNEGAMDIILTGISDGDGMTQNLSVTAISSDPAIVPNPIVAYTSGENTAMLTIDPVDTESGTVTITVTVSDDGGNANNQGDQTKVMEFTVNSILPSLTGFTVDLNDPEVLSLFGASSTYTLSVVDFEGGKALKIVMTAKSTWDGIVLYHPELNLVDNPLVSYSIYTETADPTLYHWNYFYDVNGQRCILNSNDHKYEAPVGQWTDISFDYRQEGDMSDEEGVPIDASRIDYLLINMHNTLVGWPFTEISGVCYMKNIQLGDEALVPVEEIYTTIDEIPDQIIYEGSEDIVLTLTGISNGKNSTDNVTFQLESSDPDVTDVEIGNLQENGTADLTLAIGEAGSATITVRVEGEEVSSTERSFLVNVLAEDVFSFSSIMIDREIKNQTIRGIGTFYNEADWLDLFVNDMGASAVRLGIISNEWEPVNDNDDPNIINMQGFNYDAFDWQYMRDLKAAGIESFILTSWSPPAWMKRSLTTSHTNQAVTWENTDNILEPYYYEEFAESMAALVKAFKEEADIDLLAIGLQNEPFFNEPYASAILGPSQFTELIEIVGDRFAAEGLSHVGFFMPEQVFGQNTYSTVSYINNLRLNPVADAYTEFIGVHGYDGTGVDSNFPDYSGWRSLFDVANSGDNPKELWMTETHIPYEDISSAVALAGALHGSLWGGNINLWTNWSFGDMQLTRTVPNSTFYATKQFARYIRPGAVRVDTETDNGKLLVSAFENTDGSFVIVVINSNKTSAFIEARIDGDGLPDTYNLIRTSRYEDAKEIGTYSMSEGAMIFPPSSITTMIAVEALTLSMNRPSDVLLCEITEEQQVLISGIANSEGGTDNLTLEYVVEDPEMIQNVSISGINSSGEANFVFTPIPTNPGQTKVILTLQDNLGNVREDAFYIVIDICEKVDQFDPERMKIYPNPSDGQFTLEFPGLQNETIRVMDITGKLMNSFVLDSDMMQLDLSGYQRGIYLLEIKSPQGKLVKQIIIQ